MAAPVRTDSADLAEIRNQLSAGHRLSYFYVALLGLRNYEPLRIAARVRRGLPFSALERFQRNTALPADDLAELVRLPARTWARRKDAGKLEADESDRLVRASRVFGRALELFDGDPDAARRWLLEPQPLLGGGIPLELAATDVGAIEVERVVGRLEHGIPS
jgi:putative toxin-antitoxin system antitoxin component (TIGR02293 family)